MPLRVSVVINPVSGPARRGRGPERLERARQALERLGVDADVRLTEGIGHAHELAIAAAAAGAELIVAWGGDGTINEVGRALVQHAEGGERAPVLGIVPGGSGNGLARELKIPFSPALALAHAVRAPVRTLDGGELGGHVFFNVAGIGLDAHVAALVSTRVHHRGLMPYAGAVLRDLVRYRPTHYRFEIDGRTEERTAILIAVANSTQYGFGAHIAPDAKLDDGFLDLIAVENRSVLGNLARVPSLFVGRIDRRGGVRATRIREMTIRSDSPMLFHVDGEPTQGSDTLAVRVRPRVLRVRA